MTLPESTPDPFEPLNRAVWGFNTQFMNGIIRPTSRLYRLVVPKPIRKGIKNFGRNLTFPKRLMNSTLQGKWGDVQNESARFVVNSTVGLGGVIDVGSKWKIQESDADFGKTLGGWGWRPKCYLVLPFLGASNERDALGWLVDVHQQHLQC